MTATDSNQQTLRKTGDRFAPGSFIVAAVSGFLLLVVMQCLLIVWLTYGSSFGTDDRWSVWNLWAALPLLVLFWGLFNLRWAVEALRTLSWNAAYPYLGALLCCGIGGLGLQALFAARALSDSPITLDYSHLGTPRVAAQPSAAPVAVGDATEGKSIFSLSCVTCHGPTGDGLNNLAPSLRASDFVKAADPTAILQVIVQGRTVDDPANKSGKAMPARGGNPFLTDQQAVHLAAFVKNLTEGTAVAESNSGTPVVQLSRWVVPAAAKPPEGMINLTPDKHLIGPAFQLRSEERRSELVRNLGFAAVAAHSFFLLGLFLAASQLLFGRLLGVRMTGSSTRIQIITWGWMAATLAWGLLWVLFGLS